MDYINRKISVNVARDLEREKSILLLGARQTGKTTMIVEMFKPDLAYSFVKASMRLRYEKAPLLLEQELEAFIEKNAKKPLVFIDEVQKIPHVLDIAQDLIDYKKAVFIFTGSSARKLKQGSDINLLPGRVVKYRMDPLHLDELKKPLPPIEDLLLYGSLPGLYIETDIENRERDLYSYVNNYLEDEIRSEALVRRVGDFARFLELAASESGHVINFSKISQDIGVASSTVADYFQILEDCLIIHRIDPITQSRSHRRLIKSPKYLFFDLGVRRAAANEGLRLPEQFMGHLFEQFVGLELIRQTQIISARNIVKYWRDPQGPEVDFVLDLADGHIPVEVKLAEAPKEKDCKHLLKFIDEYSCKQGFIVCRTPRPYLLYEKIRVISWQELPTLVQDLLKNQ